MEPNQEGVKFEDDHQFENVGLFSSNPFDGIIMPHQDPVLVGVTDMQSNAYGVLGNPAESFTGEVGNFNPHALVQLDQSNAEGPSSSSVSTLSSYPGPYNFSVQFSEAQDSTKATPWIFVPEFNKLYAAMNKAVPVHFFAGPLAPDEYQNFQVRIQVYFSQAEDASSVVQRCLTHQSPPPAVPMPPSQEAYGAFKKHFVLSDDQSAQYFEHANGHLSFVIPLKTPALGEEHVTSCLRFMCRTSCSGGVNRRPIAVMFTLETLEGLSLGRSCVPLRVCSCPGRDARNDVNKAKEKAVMQTNQASDQPDQEGPSKVAPGKRKRVKEGRPKTDVLDISVAPALLASPDDDELYHIEVRGRMKYEFIKSMLASWEFVESKKKKFN